MDEVARRPLGGAFSKERGSELRFPSRSAEGTPAALPPRDESESVVAGDGPDTRPSRRSPRASAPRAKRDSSITRQLSTYVSPELRERLRLATVTLGLSYERVLIYVADNYLDDIAAQLKRMPGHVLPGQGTMPRRSTSSRRVSGRHRDGHVVIQFRLSDEQIAFLDSLARQYGAVSRSALLEAMFTCFLEHLDDPDLQPPVGS